MMRSLLPLSLLLASTALAQDDTETTTFDAHGMYAPTGDGDLLDPLTMWRSEVQIPRSWAVWGTLEYANKPLVQYAEYPDGEVERQSLLDHLFGLHLSGQYSFHERVAVTANLPMWFTSVGLDGPQGVGLGDLNVSVPVGLLLPDTSEEFSVGVSVVPYLQMPTGSDASFLGSHTVSGGGSVVGTLQGGRFSGSMQLGAQGQGTAQFQNISWGSQLIYAGSFGARITDGFSLHAELHGRHVLSQQARANVGTPVEVALTSRGRNNEGLRLHGGVAAGVTPGASAAAFRAFVGGGYTFGKDQAPSDLDLDGIVDSMDQCPEDPEDFDSYKDRDGCPDLDNDEDGVLDLADDCPMDPEDMDAFEDDDGCPEDDNDQDGLVDTEDTCPLEPEDIDQFEDEDGCPDPDNDQDGVADADDLCADKLEDGADPNPADGCPTEVKTVLTKEKIVILDKVRFNTGKATLRPDAFEILDSVAQTMVDNPEIQKIRIEGHTDHQGNDDFNQDLSERRALTVRTYLISKGVDEARLMAAGYGETTPIADNETADGREQNRRVEFMVVDEEDANKGVEKGAAEAEEAPAEEAPEEE